MPAEAECFPVAATFDDLVLLAIAAAANAIGVLAAIFANDFGCSIGGGGVGKVFASSILDFCCFSLSFSFCPSSFLVAQFKLGKSASLLVLKSGVSAVLKSFSFEEPSKKLTFSNCCAI